jgi:hypothetical protein
MTGTPSTAAIASAQDPIDEGRAVRLRIVGAVGARGAHPWVEGADIASDYGTPAYGIRMR